VLELRWLSLAKCGDSKTKKENGDDSDLHRDLATC
jgi:hypothetical protein